jgi:hypothetical protein
VRQILWCAYRSASDSFQVGHIVAIQNFSATELKCDASHTGESFESITVTKKMFIYVTVKSVNVKKMIKYSHYHACYRENNVNKITKDLHNVLHVLHLISIHRSTSVNICRMSVTLFCPVLSTFLYTSLSRIYKLQI